MKLKEYQKLSVRTNANLGSDKLNLSHMVMGMCTELPELQDAIYKRDFVNVGEELSDVYWYVSNYETERGYDLSEYEILTSGRMGVDVLYYDIALLQDIVKKYVAYNKPIDVVEEKILLGKIKCNLDHMFIEYKLHKHEYLQKNIDKLKARYPEKFTEDNAINRDLDTERKILES